MWIQNVSNKNARSYSSVNPFHVSRYPSLTLVIIGSGESEKSIVKQMKIIHKEGFTDAELTDYRPIVYKNVLDSLGFCSGCHYIYEENRLGFRRV